MPLTGKVALVTGAARGIGLAIAGALHRLGSAVILADRTPADAAAASLGERAAAAVVDVSDWQAAQALVDQGLARYGHIDVLVNNAAIVNNLGRSDRMAPAEWDRELAVNLSGAFYLTRAVLPAMVQQGWGRIINVSSIAVRGLDRQVAYAASKSGLIGLTRTVALEHAARGITCNAVVPGLIGTELVLAMPSEVREAAEGLIPCGRVGDPGEVAQLVAFLALPEASYVTGAVIPVDGGASLNPMTLARRAGGKGRL